MTTIVGTLPAGVEILGMATSATCIVIATSDGPYIVQNDKLEKLEPDWKAQRTVYVADWGGVPTNG